MPPSKLAQMPKTNIHENCEKTKKSLALLESLVVNLYLGAGFGEDASPEISGVSHEHNAKSGA